MTFFYNFLIQTYYLLIRLAAPFYPKAAAWVNGRKNATTPAGKKPPQSVVWVHCASLGEFEQGRPVIEQLRQKHPDVFILLSFFSPSGFEVRKNYPVADEVVYLPLDTKKNARRFIQKYNPQLAIFVKYEFWFHFLKTLSDNNIPALLISARFRKEQLFFKSYGFFYKNMLHFFQHIFVQDNASAQLLSSHGFQKVTVCGDTRVDSVIKRKEENRQFPILDVFCTNKKILVCGSTWPADEKLLAALIRENGAAWKYIVAPHEISEKKLKALEEILPDSLRYSQATPDKAIAAQVMIIDNIGMLAFLYRLGKIAYIGGGFGKGIHNCLEAAVYEIPVIFGPRYKRFEEALQLTKSGAAFSVENNSALRATIKTLQNPTIYTQSRQAAAEYFRKSKGATGKIMHYLNTILNPNQGKTKA